MIGLSDAEKKSIRVNMAGEDAPLPEFIPDDSPNETLGDAVSSFIDNMQYGMVQNIYGRVVSDLKARWAISTMDYDPEGNDMISQEDARVGWGVDIDYDMPKHEVVKLFFMQEYNKDLESEATEGWEKGTWSAVSGASGMIFGAIADPISVGLAAGAPLAAASLVAHAAKVPGLVTSIQGASKLNKAIKLAKTARTGGLGIKLAKAVKLDKLAKLYVHKNKYVRGFTQGTEAAATNAAEIMVANQMAKSFNPEIDVTANVELGIFAGAILGGAIGTLTKPPSIKLDTSDLDEIIPKKTKKKVKKKSKRKSKTQKAKVMEEEKPGEVVKVKAKATNEEGKTPNPNVKPKLAEEEVKLAQAMDVGRDTFEEFDETIVKLAAALKVMGRESDLTKMFPFLKSAEDFDRAILDYVDQNLGGNTSRFYDDPDSHLESLFSMSNKEAMERIGKLGKLDESLPKRNYKDSDAELDDAYERQLQQLMENSNASTEPVIREVGEVGTKMDKIIDDFGTCMTGGIKGG